MQKDHKTMQEYRVKFRSTVKLFRISVYVLRSTVRLCRLISSWSNNKSTSCYLKTIGIDSRIGTVSHTVRVHNPRIRSIRTHVSNSKVNYSISGNKTQLSPVVVHAVFRINRRRIDSFIVIDYYCWQFNQRTKIHPKLGCICKFQLCYTARC